MRRKAAQRATAQRRVRMADAVVVEIARRVARGPNATRMATAGKGAANARCSAHQRHDAARCMSRRARRAQRLRARGIAVSPRRLTHRVMARAHWLPLALYTRNCRYDCVSALIGRRVVCFPPTFVNGFCACDWRLRATCYVYHDMYVVHVYMTSFVSAIVFTLRIDAKVPKRKLAVSVSWQPKRKLRRRSRHAKQLAAATRPIARRPSGRRKASSPPAARPSRTASNRVHAVKPARSLRPSTEPTAVSLRVPVLSAQQLLLPNPPRHASRPVQPRAERRPTTRARHAAGARRHALLRVQGAQERRRRASQ